MAHPELKYQGKTDAELLALYSDNKDAVIVGILFKKYAEMCLAVSLKYLKDKDQAHDSVMYVFEKLLSELSLHRIENFKSWLYTVIKNHCLMELRKEKRIEIVRETPEKNVYAFMEKQIFEHPSGTMQKENELQQLEQAILKLPEEQRKCVELFYLRENSYAEVAAKTGFDLNQVKSYIQNGKRNLKIKLQTLT